MPDVVLIRPGCTDFDAQNRIQGSLDLPLSQRGQEQVELVVRQLQGVRLDRVYSAPCEPARSTAIAICNACGATFKESADFCNLNHGLWQGLQIDDVRRKYPKVFKQWSESPETVCLPEGETLAQAVERIEHGLRKCLKRKRNVGIVASEPLATLIGCVLRGCRPELPDGDAYVQPERRIEFLHLSEDDGTRSVIASASAIGQDRNGNEIQQDASGRNGRKTNSGTEKPSAEKPGAVKPSHDGTVGDKAVNGHNGQAAHWNRSHPVNGRAVDSDAANSPTIDPRRTPE
jgi:broad specificity phosphatase PhoE